MRNASKPSRNLETEFVGVTESPPACTDFLFPLVKTTMSSAPNSLAYASCRARVLLPSSNNVLSVPIESMRISVIYERKKVTRDLFVRASEGERGCFCNGSCVAALVRKLSYRTGDIVFVERVNEKPVGCEPFRIAGIFVHDERFFEPERIENVVGADFGYRRQNHRIATLHALQKLFLRHHTFFKHDIGVSCFGFRERRAHMCAVFHRDWTHVPQKILLRRRRRGKLRINRVADNVCAFPVESVRPEPHVAMHIGAEYQHRTTDDETCERIDKTFLKGERLVFGIKANEREQVSRSLQVVLPYKISAGANDESH